MKIQSLFSLALGILCACPAIGDVLELKSGDKIQGTFVGRTDEGVQFQVGSQTLVYPHDEVANLQFGGQQPAQPAAKPEVPAQPAEAQPAQSQVVTVNAGTGLLVRMGSTISTASSKQGEFFSSTLESDLVQNGVVVAPKGTTVYGKITVLQQAGRLAGQNRLELQVTDILIDNVRVPVVTAGVGAEGAREGAKTVRNTAVGAGIGALARSDSSKGARRGAAAGAGVSMAKGQPIVINRGTLMEFRLTAPLTVTR
ncbi:MAG: hypothetical protein AB3N64_01575 [Puniceicoccaceae bacterium]